MDDRYNVEFTRRAYNHLESIRRYDRKAILDAVRENLLYSPNEQTTHRKLLRENPIADWELRVGSYRVFYEVNSGERRVRILAIGLKERNQLVIEGKEVIL